MKVLLTDRFIKTVKPLLIKERDIYNDIKVPGLSLRVTSKGEKTLSVNYRMPGNPIKQRHTLGTHLTISLADARALALKVIADAKMNIAPNSKLNAIKQEPYIKAWPRSSE